MLTEINPKLPMRDKTITRDFYVNKLHFKDIGSADFKDYLILQRDNVQIHFFEFTGLNPKENYGQVYIRTNDIEALYKSMLDTDQYIIHPDGGLKIKPWGQKEFAILDPDSNLLTFGQGI